MLNFKFLIVVGLAGASANQCLQATLANTGANVSSTGMDLNWSVKSPSYTGPAYLATPSDQWPFSPAGPWVSDDAASSWITYTTPLNLNAPGDRPATTYTYTESFTLSQAETLQVRFLSDNESSLSLVSYRPSGEQQTFIAQTGPALDPSTYTRWTYATLSLGAGSYSFNIDVNNDYWPYENGNPTGFRFEQYQIVSAIPEPTTVVASALLLVPLGMKFLRATRREDVN